MKILLSSYVHWWNAEAAYAAVLGEVLRDDGHRVWMLTRPGTRNHDALQSRGLEVITEFPLWSRRPGEVTQGVRALKRFQRRERIEIVNVFRSREMAWHLWAVRGGTGPALVKTRGSAQLIRGGWLNRKLHRDWCHGHIASCEVVRADLLSSFDLPPQRVRTIHYPTDLPPLLGPEERGSAKSRLLEELGLPSDALLLGIVGRARPEKGQHLLIEAFAELSARHPSLALLVLDKHYDDPPQYRETVQARTAELGLAHRVRWLGFRDDVREVMALIDVGVIPSTASEMNCRVAVEFFSCGVPVVAFPTGALPEVVEEDVSGRIARSRDPQALAHDPQALASTVEPLLSHRGLRERLGAGARQRAETRFSRKRFLEESLHALEDALRRR